MADENRNVSPGWSRTDPRWKAHAMYSGTLRKMLANPSMPLDRSTWIDLAYGAERPKSWTAEHELEVPDPFKLEKLSVD